MSNEIDKIAKLNNANVTSFLWVQDTHVELQKILKEYNYKRIFIGSDNYLELNNYTKFQDYLDFFRYRTRNNIKREIRAFEQLGLKIEEINNASYNVNEIVDLQYMLNKKYNIEIKKDILLEEHL